MAAPTELLEIYRSAAEALHDALLALGSRFHTNDNGEYQRLRKLVEKCQDDLDHARRGFEQTLGLKRSAGA